MKKTIRWKVAQVAELKWWKNYLTKKDPAGYLAWKRQYWGGLMERISGDVKIKAGDHVLDAGCGPAGVFMILNSCRVDAVDPLANDYESTLEHFKKSDYPYVHFYSLPFEQFESKQTYDVIFCMNAINHVSDLGKSFDKLAGLLKPGALLIITIDAHNYSLFKFIFRLLPGDILHPHQYDVGEYEKMVTERGCAIIRHIRLKHEFFFDHYLLVAQKR